MYVRCIQLVPGGTEFAHTLQASVYILLWIRLNVEQGSESMMALQPVRTAYSGNASVSV